MRWMGAGGAVYSHPVALRHGHPGPAVSCPGHLARWAGVEKYGRHFGCWEWRSRGDEQANVCKYLLLLPHLWTSLPSGLQTSGLEVWVRRVPTRPTDVHTYYYYYYYYFAYI